MNPDVDFYFNKTTKWQDEYQELRAICLDCELEEELKWGKPCYVFTDETGKEKNIVLIHGFKEYCALLFHKGVLLKDPNDILIQQTEHVQAARQMRFTDIREITDQERTIKDYIKKAIEVEKAGLEVDLKKTKEYPMPEEFQVILNDYPALKEAFKALTPGRQRGYLLYFSRAKQSKTRTARVEKYIQKILDGKGLND